MELHPVHDVETLSDLEGAFGRPRVMDLLVGLRHEIDARLATSAYQREQLGKDAHVLVSVSGTLGFMPLSRACAELEWRCLDNGDVSAALALVHVAADAAKRAIDELTSD